MATLLVRDVSNHLVEALRRRATDHGRSAQAEHKAILEAALAPANNDFWEIAKRLREQTAGRIFTDSADLIREARDER